MPAPGKGGRREGPQVLGEQPFSLSGSQLPSPLPAPSPVLPSALRLPCTGLSQQRAGGPWQGEHADLWIFLAHCSAWPGALDQANCRPSLAVGPLAQLPLTGMGADLGKGAGTLQTGRVGIRNQPGPGGIWAGMSCGWQWGRGTAVSCLDTGHCTARVLSPGSHGGGRGQRELRRGKQGSQEGEAGEQKAGVCFSSLPWHNSG